MLVRRGAEKTATLSEVEGWRDTSKNDFIVAICALLTMTDFLVLCITNCPYKYKARLQNGATVSIIGLDNFNDPMLILFLPQFLREKMLTQASP